MNQKATSVVALGVINSLPADIMAGQYQDRNSLYKAVAEQNRQRTILKYAAAHSDEAADIT